MWMDVRSKRESVTVAEKGRVTSSGGRFDQPTDHFVAGRWRGLVGPGHEGRRVGGMMRGQWACSLAEWASWAGGRGRGWRGWGRLMNERG